MDIDTDAEASVTYDAEITDPEAGGNAFDRFLAEAPDLGLASSILGGDAGNDTIGNRVGQSFTVKLNKIKPLKAQKKTLLAGRKIDLDRTYEAKYTIELHAQETGIGQGITGVQTVITATPGAVDAFTISGVRCPPEFD